MTLYDPLITHAIGAAAAQLQDSIRRYLPHSADLIGDWTIRLAGEADPAAYFRHPHAFPMLLLPWWLEQTLADAPESALQTDLAYSTMHGYYYIRLIDNLMDGHATNEQQLLPALSVFHTQFMAPYLALFAGDHPFWQRFQDVWSHAADCTIRDGAATEIDQAHFEQFSGKKVSAALIPLAAVAWRYGRTDLLPGWDAFVDLLGRWHQFFNDLFSWAKDHAAQTTTWFLCEAGRRAAAGETVSDWVMREGFDWGVALLTQWLGELRTLASRLGSQPMQEYLATRAALLAEQAAKVEAGFQAMRALVALTRPAEA